MKKGNIEIYSTKVSIETYGLVILKQVLKTALITDNRNGLMKTFLYDIGSFTLHFYWFWDLLGDAVRSNIYTVTKSRDNQGNPPLFVKTPLI